MGFVEFGFEIGHDGLPYLAGSKQLSVSGQLLAVELGCLNSMKMWICGEIGAVVKEVERKGGGS